MKERIHKTGLFFKQVFGYGIMIVLFAGGLTFFGYIIALLIGGEIASAICDFIYKTFIPVIIKTSTILILFGILTMYMTGELALTPDKKHSIKEKKR